ncbi:MAG: recombinase family protein [Desulfobulbaceae bacterium]|nr:recombinase family protein [Desulfobulbaceae bacterium]
MAVYGYLYNHTVKDEELSCSRQRELIEEYARGKKIIVDGGWIEEEESGADFLHRKAAHELLERCRAGDALIAARVGMVFRKASEGLHLIDFCRDRGVSFHLADLSGNIVLPEKRKLIVSEGISHMVTTLLRCIAQQEGSSHGSIIRGTKQKMRQKGLYLGGPVAFGWKVSEKGVLVEDEEQQLIIVEMVRLRADRWSYRDISSIILEKYAVRLSHEGVRKVLVGNKLKKDIRGNTGEIRGRHVR